MKRRVVAIFLSLTLCMGGTLEAGAAALGSTDVQMAAETAGNPAEDVFRDEAETTVQQKKKSLRRSLTVQTVQKKHLLHRRTPQRHRML